MRIDANRREVENEDDGEKAVGEHAHDARGEEERDVAAHVSFI